MPIWWSRILDFEAATFYVCMASAIQASDGLAVWLAAVKRGAAAADHLVSTGIPCDATAYIDRNRIERAFCRLKDWRRIATRYDKLASNFASAVAIAAIILWWT